MGDIGQLDHRRRPIRGTLAERFWPKVIEDANGCWVWTGNRTKDGYARFSVRGGLTIPAYRWAYEQMVGPIPDGLEPDHLCLNKACVNPEHIEPVTREVNVQRALFVKHGSSAEFCPNGHPRTPENRVQRKRPRGITGECKVCNRERMRQRSAVEKQAS